MGKRGMARQGEDLVVEVARIVCEEALVDYRSAKLKAAHRMGLGRRASLPENARIETAVIDYQKLCGGPAYRRRLRQLRQVAMRTMQLLAPFEPRLVGAVASGAITDSHRVQLHAFAEPAEALEMFLHDRGVHLQQADRDYRYADGRSVCIPIVRIEASGIGVDVAIFDRDGLAHPPLSPVSRRPARRLDLAGVQALTAGGEPPANLG